MSFVNGLYSFFTFVLIFEQIIYRFWLSQINLPPQGITSLASDSWERVIRKSGAVPFGWEEDNHYQIVGWADLLYSSLVDVFVPILLITSWLFCCSYNEGFSRFLDILGAPSIAKKIILKSPGNLTTESFGNGTFLFVFERGELQRCRMVQEVWKLGWIEVNQIQPSEHMSHPVLFSPAAKRAGLWTAKLRRPIPTLGCWGH